MATVTYTYNVDGVYTLVLPADTVVVEIAAWGGGGCGSGRQNVGVGGGGGGGGCIVATFGSFLAGETLEVTVGRGGDIGQARKDGESSSVFVTGLKAYGLVEAYGGVGHLMNTTFGNTGSLGTWHNSALIAVASKGGDGAAGFIDISNSYFGGGGGASGNLSGNDGADANLNYGGVGEYNGGSGGNGAYNVISGGEGSAGTQPGGGGGGAAMKIQGRTAYGGIGGDGYVLVTVTTYEEPPPVDSNIVMNIIDEFL